MSLPLPGEARNPGQPHPCLLARASPVKPAPGFAGERYVMASEISRIWIERIECGNSDDAAAIWQRALKRRG